MLPDDNPNEIRLWRSTAAPNHWHCSYTVDFSTPDGAEMSRKICSSEGVLHLLQAAFGNCWLELRERDQDLATLRREMKCLMDRMIENLHAHPQTFGIDGGPPDPAAGNFRDAIDDGGFAPLLLQAATELCAKMLLDEKRSIDSVERETRRLFEQALAGVRTSPASFIEWP